LGGDAFIGTDFGAAAFLGFFFSLVRELLPFPIVGTGPQERAYQELLVALELLHDKFSPH
jgi:hypothetical protein